MDINYQYSVKRFNLGKQPLFCEQGPEMCDSIVPCAIEQKKFILRNPVHQPTQNTPDFSEHHINTLRADYVTSGVNHAEGGWPKDVLVTDPELTQRYRRKVEKDDGYIHCVMSSSPGLEHYALQNNAIDMYRIFYCEMPSLPSLERISCRTVNVYRDSVEPTRPISSINWEPDSHRFAVTYNDVDFNRIARAPLDSLIWNLENPMEPELVIDPPCALLDLQFNPRDRSIMAGGLMNGQVGAWDIRVGGEPTVLCAPHVAHRDLVRNVIFINAKNGQEFFSGGPDGVCKWWDMRNMNHFTDEIILDVVKHSLELPSIGRANGISTLEFEPTIPTRFMAGTENGLVIGGNRKGKTALEKVPVKLDAHIGPVWSVERNPSFLKNILTVGDWTARIWSEDCRESAIMWSPPLRHKITAATWSPTKLSLMLMSQWDGLLSVWDLLRRHHEPVLTMQVCEEPLLRLAMHEGGSLLACGSQKGNIYMVEMSSSLVQSEKNDKVLMTQMLERESKRERILEARMREIRLKLRQAEEAGAEGSPAESTTELEMMLGDKDLIEATAEYMAQVKKDQLTMV